MVAAKLFLQLRPLWQRVEATPLYRSFRSLPTRQQIALGTAFFVLINLTIIAALYFSLGINVAAGYTASLFAGLATLSGALPVLLLRRVSLRFINFVMGAAAGIMLAAIAFSLVEPGLEYGELLWPGKGSFVVVVGMFLGALFLDWADRQLPQDLPTVGGSSVEAMRRIWLFVLAVTLHNFPEGLSIGVTFGSGDAHNGKMLVVAIMSQNFPEGMAVALPLVAVGFSPLAAAGIALAAGLAEPVGGFLGATMVTVFGTIIPWAMGFAAGAMMYLVAYELIPELQSKERSKLAVFGVLVGFVVMTILDQIIE